MIVSFWVGNTFKPEFIYNKWATRNPLKIKGDGHSILVGMEERKGLPYRQQEIRADEAL